MADDGKITSYLFTVEIDGIETARFQKCEGLEAETYVYEVEEGGLNNTTHKFYGRTRYPNIITEKGITDNDEYLKRTREFIDSLDTVKKVEVLPYHTLGEYKWKELGIPYKLEGVDPPSEERVQNAKKILEFSKY